MSQPPPPGKKAQGLGAQLREIRKSRRLLGKQVAERLGWSESKVSRLETGHRPLSSEEVAGYLAILDVTGNERDRLMAMARTPDEPAWLDTVRSGLPDTSIALSTYESEATRLTNWAPLLIPGLLQTMEYGRAFMLADGIPEPEIGTRLMARAHRQQRLEQAEYVAYIDETVLYRRVGNEQVMRSQLRHLLDMAERDNVTIRLISVKADAHSGLITPYLLIEFELTPPIVHIELSRSGVFLSEEAETAPYTENVARLDSISMDQADSLRAIKSLLGERGSDR